jgi:hypothetical protein
VSVLDDVARDLVESELPAAFWPSALRPQTRFRPALSRQSFEMSLPRARQVFWAPQRSARLEPDDGAPH